MADLASEVDGAAHRVLAEAVGLLLEPLPVDESLSGPELLDVVRALAAIAADSDATGAVEADLDAAIAAVATSADLTEALRAACAGTTLGADEVTGCLHLLAAGATA